MLDLGATMETRLSPEPLRLSARTGQPPGGARGAAGLGVRHAGGLGWRLQWRQPQRARPLTRPLPPPLTQRVPRDPAHSPVPLPAVLGDIACIAASG